MLFTHIIAHRGLPNFNTLYAIESALNRGFSIETDIRSYNGNLYISHDPICSDRLPDNFKDFLTIAIKHKNKNFFLNIKEDGLLPYLIVNRNLIEELNIVFFDMSVPELSRYVKLFPPSKLATRISDVEKIPAFLDYCDWLWVDCFKKELLVEEIEYIQKNYFKKFVFVSPELHGRPFVDFWEIIDNPIFEKSKIHICTDHPDELLKKWGAHDKSDNI